MNKDDFKQYINLCKKYDFNQIINMFSTNNCLIKFNNVFQEKGMSIAKEIYEDYHKMKNVQVGGGFKSNEPFNPSMIDKKSASEELIPAKKKIKKKHIRCIRHKCIQMPSLSDRFI